jgi:hypothetical protein
MQSGVVPERLERRQPNPQSEPRTSSNLNTLARLGAAIANGGMATFLVVALLIHGNADPPDRRAEDVSALHSSGSAAHRQRPISGIHLDGTAADQDALFREFSQWLSKRSGRQD